MISLTEPSQSERGEILGLRVAPGIWGDMRGAEKVAEKSLVAPTWDQGEGANVGAELARASRTRSAEKSGMSGVSWMHPVPGGGLGIPHSQTQRPGMPHGRCALAAVHGDHRGKVKSLSPGL